MAGRFRVGVDIGGTFTDFTVVDESGRVFLWKEDSTPDDPTRAIEVGLAAVADELGLDPGDALLGETSLLVHGTTIATNAVIERSAPLVGLMATDGFRDVLYYRNGYKPERFNIHLQHPAPLVPRYLRIGVPERLDPQGDELRPLDEDAVREAASTYRRAGVGAVAVAFLWSIINPGHEQRAAEILEQELPGVHILCSHEILSEIGEWERTSATALSAYVLPTIHEYLSRLEQLLRDGGLARPPLIMQINGGCASVAEILRRPVTALASGPAAGPAAALFHASAIGARDLITVDMGGTSLDVSVIRDGRPAMSRTIRVEEQPVGVPAVEVHSIGAGGGSIAWVDAGGALKVGPQSAGARPGPACYGQGGDLPTVTDANVVLGYLEPEAFLGGRRSLRPDLAEQAIARHIAEPLGLDPIQAAAGIVRVVDSNIVSAIRAVSVERGIDPRGFALVAGGGAGGLHATRLARALGIQRVLIPREAGTFCAFGMTVTDVRHDYARPHHTLSSDLDLEHVGSLLAELDTDARARLDKDGFAEGQIALEHSVDARYPGQIHEITIPIPSSVDGAFVDQVLRTFHEEHFRRFTYARQDVPIEFLHWRVSAYGLVSVAPAAATAAGIGDHAPEMLGTRTAYFDSERSWLEVGVYSADSLSAGSSISGPAIVQAPTTTIVLQPAERLEVPVPDLFVVQLDIESVTDGERRAREEVGG